MPIYVTVSYAVFCVVPLGLALSIHLRRRRVVRDMRRLEERLSDRGQET